MLENQTLSREERLDLAEALATLPAPQFQTLKFVLNPPAGILPSDSSALRARAIALLEWAENTGPGLVVLKETLDQVIGKPLVAKQANHLTTADCAELFEAFSPYDFAVMQSAFLHAFQRVKGNDFWNVRPDHKPLTDPKQIQSLLQVYKPVLAVRFVEQVIATWQASGEAAERDLMPFEQWRDRITQAFGVPPQVPEQPSPNPCQGYLLIALEAHGAAINLFPELHVLGEANPIKFGASPTTCTLDQVPSHLSQWIRAAENKLAIYDCGRVHLELFLPCQYLEEITDLADSWQVENQQGRLRPLGKHRGFVVRALERISDRPTQVVLKKNWQRLEECVQNNDACEKFHLQADCPNIGDLEDVRHVPGLKLVAELPSEESDRQEIFYDIINAAVPIALWFGQDNTQTPDQRIMELDQLLQDRQLTNFADLAQHWKQKRATAHIRLLCDRPDRRPNLPDPTQEEDLLVAS